MSTVVSVMIFTSLKYSYQFFLQYILQINSTDDHNHNKYVNILMLTGESSIRSAAHQGMGVTHHVNYALPMLIQGVH